MVRTTVLALATLLILTGSAWATVADFDGLTLAADSYWNGGPVSGDHTFVSGGATFNNLFDDTYGSYWCGWAYSNKIDNETPGYLNQYSAITITKAAHSGQNYGIGYVDTWYYGITPTITLATPSVVDSAWFTNATYPYLIMRDGDPDMRLAKQFGGDTGDDPDWFLLTITGKDAAEQVTGTVDFYLADYRFDDNAQDYIVDDWTWVDLRPLGTVKSVEFTLSSSDTDFYMNTPSYFAMDTLTISPEPATLGLVALGLAALARRRRA